MCKWKHIFPLLGKKVNSTLLDSIYLLKTRMSLFLGKKYFALLSVFTIYRVIN